MDKRRLIQLYSAVLYNAHIKGFVKGEIFTGSTKAVCVPGLNCYSCPGATGSCPLGALQNALSSADKSALFYVVGILLLYGLIFGRTICGFLCPFGLIQELLHKIPTVKIKKSKVTRILSYLKYVILVVFVFIITIWMSVSQGIPVPAFCKYICPAGTFEGAVMLLSNEENVSFFSMLGAVFTNKFVILALIALLCVFCYRAFCRFLCPLGAIYGLFSKFSVIGIKVDSTRCNGCSKCLRECPVDIKRVGDHECIHCTKCINICDQEAISLKAGKYTVIPSSKEKKDSKVVKIALIVLAVILIFALLYFNVFKKEESVITVYSSPSSSMYQIDSSVTYGSAVGNQLQNFSITCLDGSDFTLFEYRDKVVFINLWATYCGPCVKEIPYFNAFVGSHDDVVVLAVHSSLVTDDVKSYVKQNFDSYDVKFATDYEDERIWTLVGGSSAMPQTIVVNGSGKVIYNQVGSVTPEMLDKLYEQAKDSE